MLHLHAARERALRRLQRLREVAHLVARIALYVRRLHVEVRQRGAAAAQPQPAAQCSKGVQSADSTGSEGAAGGGHDV